MSTQKTQRQPMSDRHKLIIIIVAICLAAVIAVSVTLGVLLKEPTKTSNTENPGTTPSSNLPVKNGDFALVGSEDTAYPKSALNWNKYGYKAPSGNTHDFETIDTNANVVMGIIDTDDEKWQEVIDDLKVEDIELSANPKQHNFLGANDKHDNSNIYMIATKIATNAMIMSDSVSVSATTSVKITIHVNTAQLTSGKAQIMIQNSSSTPNAKEENRYAYKFDIAQESEWQEIEFWVFNRKTSTQYIRVAVGLGNSYDEALTEDERKAEGAIFIDDIQYETVTANDYRLRADEAKPGDTSFKIIEKEEDTTVAQYSEYLTLKGMNDEEKTIDFATSESYVNETKTADDANGYSPFTIKDDFTKAEDSKTVGNFGIYKLENNGDTKAPVALQLSKAIELKLDEDDDGKQDYAHVSFWARTVMNNKLAYANILVQSMGDDGEWATLSSGDFEIRTEQNIETDTNNGWTKYDVYLKPAQTNSQVRIVFALGSANGYEGTGYAPKGTLYITTPYYETISSSAYTSASSATASKKYDLTGSTAETTVSNGSFSSISANTNYPTNWTPAFAGQNIIYKDGKGDDTTGAFANLSTKAEAVAGSGVIDNPDKDHVDDDANKILKLVSNEKSSYGLMSNDITASAHTVYVFSVLAKVGAAKPYFYLIENGVERANAVRAKVENTYVQNVDGYNFCLADDFNKNGWVRYYIVYVTGDKDTTVKLALFNGSIDGTEPAEAGTTIYYDNVTMQTLGTYSMVEDEDNEEATEYKVSFTATSGYTAFEDCEDIVAVLAKVKELGVTENAVKEPAAEEWTEMKTIPEEEEDNDDDDDTDTTTPNRDVNLALLFSILSSVLLVAALAVVVVVKIFKKRNRNN